MSSENLYQCKLHNKKFVGYCESCNIDICLLCTAKHEKHELLQYNEIQPSTKKIEELKNNFIEYKKKNKILISRMQLWLEKINFYSKKIIEILENNEKLYESTFSNYEENNFIFTVIDNMNTIRKKGLVDGYKHINLDVFENEDKILDKSDLIIKTIKEMQIEDIFLSMKNQKNIIQQEKTEQKINEKEKEHEQKKMEDTKEKKIE